MMHSDCMATARYTSHEHLCQYQMHHEGPHRCCSCQHEWR